MITAVAQRVGIDLTSVAAVRDALAAHGARYLARVYTTREQVDCGGDPARLAARFAAKEATIKVLRPGQRTPLPWVDIEVIREADGHVELVLAGRAAAQAVAAGLGDFAVSLTHEGDRACAVVIAQNGSIATGGTCR